MHCSCKICPIRFGDRSQLSCRLTLTRHGINPRLNGHLGFVSTMSFFYDFEDLSWFGFVNCVTVFWRSWRCWLGFVDGVWCVDDLGVSMSGSIDECGFCFFLHDSIVADIKYSCAAWCHVTRDACMSMPRCRWFWMLATSPWRNRSWMSTHSMCRRSIAADTSRSVSNYSRSPPAVFFQRRYFSGKPLLIKCQVTHLVCRSGVS